jgi:hypothetical protein
MITGGEVYFDYPGKWETLKNQNHSQISKSRTSQMQVWNVTANAIRSVTWILMCMFKTDVEQLSETHAILKCGFK